MVSSPNPLVACILIVVILAATVCLSELSWLPDITAGLSDILVGWL